MKRAMSSKFDTTRFEILIQNWVEEAKSYRLKSRRYFKEIKDSVEKIETEDDKAFVNLKLGNFKFEKK